MIYSQIRSEYSFILNLRLVVVLLFNFEHLLCISQQLQNYLFLKGTIYSVSIFGTNLAHCPQIGKLPFVMFKLNFKIAFRSLKIFDCHFIYGNSATALNDPDAVVLTALLQKGFLEARIL